MERLESEDARHRFSADDGEDQQLPRNNEYPDPDSLSARPWWRESYLPQDSNDYGERYAPQASPYTQGRSECTPDIDSLSPITSATDGSVPSAINERSIISLSNRKLNYDDESTFELALEDTT